MTTRRAPGEIRLERETIRMVRIPYPNAFGKRRQNLSNAVKHGMKTDPLVSKRVLKMRLEGEDFGEWMCPRLSGGHRGSLVHKKVLESPGICFEPFDQGMDGKCGRKLEVLESHWHELAESFGFLESQGDSYIYGKFGSVSRFLDSEIWNADREESRARRALYLISLLVNHADFLLPVLWVLINPSTTESDFNSRVLGIFRANLKNRSESYSGENFPASQAVLQIREMFKTRIMEFSDYETEKPPRSVPKILDIPKTQNSYVSRARSYLSDLEMIEGSRNRLTSGGTRMVDALQRKGIMVSEDTCYLPPSFEAIHDVFSFTMDRYTRIFNPAVNHQIIEDVVMATLLPDTHPVPWERYRSDLTRTLPYVVKGVGNQLTAGAHVDTARLALFSRQVGKGTPTILDDQADIVGGDMDGIRNNAIINIAADDATTYVLGSARVGRRLWSVNLRVNVN